jgi:hypothetical protein
MTLCGVLFCADAVPVPNKTMPSINIGRRIDNPPRRIERFAAILCRLMRSAERLI